MENKTNKSYRIRTKVGEELKTAQDINLLVNFIQEYETFELLSIKMKTENLYKLHNANYGVVVGRVQANGGFGVPNAKISIFMEVDQDNENSEILAIYGYTDIFETNSLGDTYNLLPNEQVNDCHQKIGAFPSKRYLLDNDTYIEVFDKYYKYTTRTNNAGDYIIVGVPVGNQTLHMDLDLSDCGILSQKPRDFVYKGYTIEQFENPNQFKSASGASINFLSQYVQQTKTVYVNPLWGSNELGETIGITRADIDVNFKFEPTCVFMGSIVSDSRSNGLSQKCVPTDQMGVMDELTTGRGTIEMIRKTPSGAVEEFQIKGNELIDGNGVWCYQIPMNLDYVTTNEYGETVATDNPQIGIPTRARVRFRMSLDNFEDSNDNYFVGKMLVPNNPQIIKDAVTGEQSLNYDYAFGSETEDSSYRDLFWNNVYSVKQHIPRIQKSGSWRTDRFTGIKQCNFYGQNNPIPYNSIRIKLPFMFVVLCAIIKTYVRIVSFLNAIINTIFQVLTAFIYTMLIMFTIIIYPIFLSISWLLFFIAWLAGNKDMTETLTSIAKLDVKNWPFVKRLENMSYVTIADGICPDLESWYFAPAALVRTSPYCAEQVIFGKNYNICEQTIKKIEKGEGDVNDSTAVDTVNPDTGDNEKICITRNTDYLMSCIEMNLAQEYKVIKFDFYNDWVNGLIYLPRWKFRPAHKATFLFGLIRFHIKEKGCFDDNTIFGKTRKLTQHCSLGYNSFNFGGGLIGYSKVGTSYGCSQTKGAQKCHKNPGKRYTSIFGPNGGLIHKEKTMLGQTVYYYKPSEMSLNLKDNQTKINLFATDLILLGSLNDCDENGVPQAFKWLSSSSYKMPTNLALTNLDEAGVVYNDGNSYCKGGNSADKMVNEGVSVAANTYGGQIEWSSTAPVEIQITGYGNAANSIENVVDSINDKIAVTEAAGISWDYTGPQQLDNDNNNIFSPGGHFLGMSCVRAQTNIKSCINLQRICEAGASMSERIERTRAIEETVDGKYNPLYYVLSPNGLISNDEIIAASFRNMFATLNINPLIATRKDEKTGYFKYNFTYLRANGFDGGAKKNVVSRSLNYNSAITVNIESGLDNEASQNEYDFDKDYDTGHTYHRAIESANLGYYRFRFGLRNAEPKTFSQEAKAKYALELNGLMYLPQYENSFYFYFGLKDGNTALDKFYSDFFSMCPAREITKKPNVKFRTDNYAYCTRENGVWVTTENIKLPYDITVTRKDGLTIEADNVSYRMVHICGLLPGEWTVTVKEYEGITLNKKLNIGSNLKDISGVQFNDFKENLETFTYKESVARFQNSKGREVEGGTIEFSSKNVSVFGMTLKEFYDKYIGDMNKGIGFILVGRSSDKYNPDYKVLQIKCQDGVNLSVGSFNKVNFHNVSTKEVVTDFEFDLTGKKSPTQANVKSLETKGDAAKIHMWGDNIRYTLYFIYQCGDKYAALELWSKLSEGYSIFNVYVGSKYLKYNGKNSEGFSLKGFLDNLTPADASDYGKLIKKINNIKSNGSESLITQWALRQALFDQRYDISQDSSDRLIRCTNLQGEFVDGITFGQAERIMSKGTSDTSSILPYETFNEQPLLFSDEDYSTYAGYEIDDEASLLPSIGYIYSNSRKRQSDAVKLPYYKMSYDDNTRKILSESIGVFMLTTSPARTPIFKGVNSEFLFGIIKLNSGVQQGVLCKGKPYILQYKADDDSDDVMLDCTLFLINSNKCAFIIPKETLDKSGVDIQRLRADGTEFSVHPCIVIPVIHRPFYFNAYPLFLGNFSNYGESFTDGEVVYSDEAIKNARETENLDVIELGTHARDLMVTISDKNSAGNMNVAWGVFDIYGGNGYGPIRNIVGYNEDVASLVGTGTIGGSAKFAPYSRKASSAAGFDRMDGRAASCSLGECDLLTVSYGRLSIDDSIASEDVTAKSERTINLSAAKYGNDNDNDNEGNGVSDVFPETLKVKLVSGFPSVSSNSDEYKDILSFVDGKKENIDVTTEYEVDNLLPKEIVIRKETNPDAIKEGHKEESDKYVCYLDIGDNETVNIEDVNNNVKFYMVVYPQVNMNGNGYVEKYRLLPIEATKKCNSNTIRGLFTGKIFKNSKYDVNQILGSYCLKDYLSNPSAVAFAIDQIIEASHHAVFKSTLNTNDYIDGGYFKIIDNSYYGVPGIIYSENFGSSVYSPFLSKDVTVKGKKINSATGGTDSSCITLTGFSKTINSKGEEIKEKKGYEYKLDIATLLSEPILRDSTSSTNSILDDVKSMKLSKKMAMFGYKTDVVLKGGECVNTRSSSYEAMVDEYIKDMLAYGPSMDDNATTTITDFLNKIIKENRKYILNPLTLNSFDAVIARNWSFPNIEFVYDKDYSNKTTTTTIKEFVQELIWQYKTDKNYASVIEKYFITGNRKGDEELRANSFNICKDKKPVEDCALNEIYNRYLEGYSDAFIVPITLGELKDGKTSSLEWLNKRILETMEEGYNYKGPRPNVGLMKQGRVMYNDGSWTLNKATRNTMMASKLSRPVSLENAIFDENMSLGFRSVIIGIQEGQEGGAFSPLDKDGGTNNSILPFKIYTFHSKGLSSVGNDNQKYYATHNQGDNFRPNGYNENKYDNVTQETLFPAYYYETVINDYDNHASGWC